MCMLTFNYFGSRVKFGIFDTHSHAIVWRRLSPRIQRACIVSRMGGVVVGELKWACKGLMLKLSKRGRRICLGGSCGY